MHACMDLESILLSEASQKSKKILYNITYMCSLKNNTNESVYRTEIKSGIENNLWLSKEKGKW